MVDLVLAKSINDISFFMDVKPLFKHLDQNSFQYNIFIVTSKFFEQYNKMPNREECKFYLVQSLNDNEKKFLESYYSAVSMVYSFLETVEKIDSKVLLDKVQEQVTRKQISDEIVKTVDQFNNTTTDTLLDGLRQLVFKHENTKRKDEYFFSDIKENIPKIRFSHNARLSTRLNVFDNCLYGGLGRKEITIFMAPSGRGKSILLANLNFGLTVGGINSWYITLETSAEATMMRTYRRAMLKDKNYMREETNESTIVQQLTRFYSTCQAQSKLSYYPANTFAMEDLDAELMKLKLSGGFFPDVIFIDHLDLMCTKDKRINMKGEVAYWRYIVDGLRAIAIKYDIALATATQTNRGALKKELITADDIGESFGKVQSADVLISINQTDEEKNNNRMRLYVAKNRDYIAGTIVEVYCNLDYMAIMDVDDAFNSGMLYAPAVSEGIQKTVESFNQPPLDIDDVSSSLMVGIH